jgi:heat shock protein HslJ
MMPPRFLEQSTRRVQRRRIGSVLPAVAVSVMLAAATAGCEDTGIGAGELADRTFVATEIEGASLPDETAITLVFTNDSLTLSAGCNAIRADIETSGGPLDVQDLARSDLTCPPDVDALEQWLVGVLDDGPTADVSDGTLVLSAPSGSITATEVG